MNIAFFSDLHIGVHKNSIEWYKIALKWCSWFINQCRENKVDKVIFCGDFFHHRDTINVQTLNIGKKIIDAISDKFPLYLLAGNHDCYFSDNANVNSVSLWKNNNVHVIDKLTSIPFDNTEIIFAPWGTDLNNLSTGDVLIAHCELNNFKLNNGKVSDCKLEANTILDKIPLAFIGHIHLRTERKYGKEKQIIYVGNPFEQDFNDEGNQKGIYIYNTENKNIKFIENTVSPKHQRVYASKLQENIEPNSIIKLVVDKQVTDEELNQIKAQINLSQPFQILDTDYKDKYETIQTENGEFDVNANVTIDNVLVEYINSLDIEYKNEITDKLLQSYQKYC